MRLGSDLYIVRTISVLSVRFQSYRTRSAGLDSLIRLLLGVEYVQPSVASVLLQKLTEYMDDTGNVE